MATASLRELDPPMHHAPFPAGFPLRGESPRLLAEESVTDRSAKHQLRKELAEQEPRYENGRPPYPSGFPLPREASLTTQRSAGSRGLTRIERKYLYEKNDPDIELAPSGFLEPVPTPRRTYKTYVPATPDRQDYLSAYTEKEVRARLERATPREQAPAVPPQQIAVAGTTKVVQEWWKETQKSIAEAERLGKYVQEKLEEATVKANLSNKLREEAENAKQLEIEARNEAKETPGKAKVAVIRIKEELADAKGEVLERVREYQIAQDDVKRYELDRETKLAEAKVVAKAARARRNELNELERLVARLDTVRRETQEAEARTEQVSQEVKELQDLLAQKQRALEDKLEELNKVRADINRLAQEYSAAVSEHETADAVVQRNLKIAEELKREAEKKRADAVRLAKEWEQAKNDAQKAAQEEVEIWKKARESGQEEERLVTEVTEKLPTPKIATEQREQAGEQLTPRPLRDLQEEEYPQDT